MRQTYSTHPDATHGRNTTVDLFADIAGKTNQAWSGINWANSIRHEYDQACPYVGLIYRVALRYTCCRLERP
ncbi:hypothetical protein [Flocculibacter collagenilyticus]|uniref:hypothetical protein n=1 Tax=Flocculibacter collagenilyticus TaxID=2744479 RepID=UPI0018F6DDAD|nr:hypothetical protein [Flocculibacter collagenilyticus]